MKDPLAGKRKAIARKEVSVLIWPAVDKDGKPLDAPVSKGDRFDVYGVPVIQIESCNRKLPAGKPAEWHATFVRHEVDRPQLLRRVPSGLPTPHDRSDGLTAIERARIESAYTSSPKQAIVDEPESVGPDWKDRSRAKREAARQEARLKRLEQNRQEAEVDRLAARVRQLGKEQTRKGKDLTPLLADIYERLAAEAREAA